MQEANKLKAWVWQGGASHHFPILLHIRKDKNKPPGTFMCNPKQMEDDDFKRRVIQT
jgi:hypothetical protein